MVIDPKQKTLYNGSIFIDLNKGMTMKARTLTKETILNYGVEDRGFPDFRVGDTIEVSQVVKEGDKERLQKFEGDVIDMRQNGISSTFTVRKIGANSVGIERIYPYYSKIVNSVKLVRHGKVRRANLRYIRERLGKAAYVEERAKVSSVAAK